MFSTTYIQSIVSAIVRYYKEDYQSINVFVLDADDYYGIGIPLADAVIDGVCAWIDAHRPIVPLGLGITFDSIEEMMEYFS
jgi:hypothetical protein